MVCDTAYGLCHKTCKCLDHIWTNKPQYLYKASERDIFISDHLPIQCLHQFKRSQINKQKHSTITYQNMKNFNKTEFHHALSATVWDTAFIFNDIDDIADAWYCLFNNAIDEQAPLITKRIKRRVKPQWFTDDIITLIRNRDFILKRANSVE